MNKPFYNFKEKGRVLLEPKLGQLPGIHSPHKGEDAPRQEHLVLDYIHFLHQELQILKTKDIPESYRHYLPS